MRTGYLPARVAVNASKIASYPGETARLPGRTMMHGKTWLPSVYMYNYVTNMHVRLPDPRGQKQS